jgi:hypothetical protein
VSDQVGIILYDSCSEFVSVNGTYIYNGECVHHVGVSLRKIHRSSVAIFFSCRIFLEGWDGGVQFNVLIVIYVRFPYEHFCNLRA